jgi:hypothetical protein
VCKLLGITDEKVNQTDELVTQTTEIIEQQTELCECLEVVQGDEDTECPECEGGLVNKQFRFFAFDDGNGFFNDPDYVMSVTVNGGTPTAQTSSSGTTKSSNYTDAYAAINAEPGWSIVVVNDVDESANGKVEHLVEYVGVPGATLTVVNNHTGDTHTFTVAEDGTCTGASTDGGGDPISSPIIEVI